MPPSDFCSTPSDNLGHDHLPLAAHAPRSLPHRLWHLLRDGTGRVGKLLDPAFDWYGCRHQALKCRRDLARLDESMLKDIGLSRADIEREIEKPFWRL
ncbi:MAG TPA: DUF1127 domain-containing protein [Dongiaceae bacterium]|nr:DUF1127 domain-containing protein [Dongiaceae bacterium]